MKIDPSPDSQRRGSWALPLWAVLVAAGLAFYLLHRDQFTAPSIAAFLRERSDHVLIVYFAVSVARAFFLIPSTPFVLAGALLLPDRPLEVLLISMAGIATASSLIYWFSDWLGFRQHFERLSPESLWRMQRILDNRYGFLILVAWAFFPLAPTDAACYAAGIVRMHFGKFLLGICLGELALCALCIYAGTETRTLVDAWLLS